jgi:hypothetical protein
VLSYCCIERPCLRLKDRLRHRGPNTTANAPVPVGSTEDRAPAPQAAA